MERFTWAAELDDEGVWVSNSFHLTDAVYIGAGRIPGYLEIGVAEHSRPPTGNRALPYVPHLIVSLLVFEAIRYLVLLAVVIPWPWTEPFLVSCGRVVTSVETEPLAVESGRFVRAIGAFSHPRQWVRARECEMGPDTERSHQSGKHCVRRQAAVRSTFRSVDVLSVLAVCDEKLRTQSFGMSACRVTGTKSCRRDGVRGT